MKRCPQCGRDYNDPTLSFCLDDGTSLLDGPASMDEPLTAILPDPVGTSESPTRTLDTEDAEVTKLYADKPGKALPPKTRIIVGMAAFIVAALAVGGYWYFGRANSDQIDSIAVLPFENPDNNSDTEYLSDGVAESIIYELTKIPELKITPRTSAFRYKGSDVDVREAGKELGVDVVLSGRISQRGENLMISVDLVDVRNDRIIWGQQYRRTVSDLLKTQNEITAAISGNLRKKLGDDASVEPQSYTENNEAYRNYLRGNYFLSKRTEEGLDNSVKSFGTAIELDPEFALAYVGLAKAHILSASYSYSFLRDVERPAKAAVSKALRIDPDLAEAHVANGLLLSLVDWDWKGAESAFRRALELKPDLAEAHYFYGMWGLRIRGSYDEAVLEVAKAVEIEPMAIPMGANLARMYYYAGQYDKALDQGKKVLALDKGHPTTLFWLGRIYNYLGKYSEAKQMCGVQGGELSADCKSIIGFASAKEGNTAYARQLLDELYASEPPDSGSGVTRATVHIALGEMERALEELEKDFDVRESSISDIVSDPIFAPLKNEPRYKAMVRGMGLEQ